MGPGLAEATPPCRAIHRLTFTYLWQIPCDHKQPQSELKCHARMTLIVVNNQSDPP
jgi:hypothetical protein